MTFNWNRLTVTVSAKGKKLIKLDNDIKEKRNFLNITYFWTLVIFIYILFHIDDYIDYLVSAFYNMFTITTPSMPNLSLFNRFMAFLLFFFVLAIYWHLNTLKKLEKKFNDLRINVIDSINSGFCYHNNSCTCKDDYILFMRKEKGIDLIFK
ncbi:hypothetical protein RH915_10915 [Serpentinicella sp. ANB-PHB4]|uniref:hypothetical protein n=1 Tax=Serpentinicella sp. ANB-PHB4 TaxID=3074076 RepID=UPI002863EAFF|nr:hypothetical protein [Serpentinicella sp. ANB-PHB4]MDR5660000.1 hypothetical protein [Serpentinicella sp. ANB-PHB4]